MTKPNYTVACSLTDAELRERRTEILQKAGRAVLEVREMKDGYAYRFPADDSWLKELTQIVLLERQCCPFLTFKITVEANHNSIWLELSGPQGTKDFLVSFLSARLSAPRARCE